jgi:hypothetical protein
MLATRSIPTKRGNKMARNTGIASVIGLLPSLIFTAVIGTGGYFGATSIMGQMPGNETSCKITQFETVKDSPNEFLIHTDGCDNSAVKEHTFRADQKEFEASFNDSQFTTDDFYKGIAAGKTYNLTIQGVNFQPLNMVPKVVKVSEDYMPY